MNQRKGLRRLIPAPIVIGILATTVAALAAFLVVINLNGTITAGDFDVFVNSGASGTTNDTSTCTVAQVDGKNLSIVWTDAYAGSECTITATFQGLVSNAKDAVLEDFTLTGVAGGEITRSLDAGATADCGATIVGSATETVDLVLTMTTAATPTAVYDITASTFDWVPSGSEDLTGCA